MPTPVGNLEDITLRALRILKEADLVLAEDTRTSGILLKHYEIKNQLVAHHKFNEHQTAEAFAARMAGGEIMALVSDAGTPGISDPGFMLVRACVARGVTVQCLPGATAFVPALVASGLPCERFCFEGFLPQKKGRNTRLQSLVQEERTMIFYESPYRVVKTLAQFVEFSEPNVAARLAAKFRNFTKKACAEHWPRCWRISLKTNRVESSLSWSKDVNHRKKARKIKNRNPANNSLFDMVVLKL